MGLLESIEKLEKGDFDLGKCLCPDCKNLVRAECPPSFCEKKLHKDYEPVTKCEGFERGKPQDEMVR